MRFALLSLTLLAPSAWAQTPAQLDFFEYRYSGRDFRLTDVYGRAVKEVLS